MDNGCCNWGLRGNPRICTTYVQQSCQTMFWLLTSSFSETWSVSDPNCLAPGKKLGRCQAVQWGKICLENRGVGEQSKAIAGRGWGGSENNFQLCLSYPLTPVYHHQSTIFLHIINGFLANYCLTVVRYEPPKVTLVSNKSSPWPCTAGSIMSWSSDY